MVCPIVILTVSEAERDLLDAVAAGQAGDLLSHELDQVQCTLRWGIPDACMCLGHNAHYHDDREVPDTWLANYTFEKHNCSLLFEGCMNSRQTTICLRH